MVLTIFCLCERSEAIWGLEASPQVAAEGMRVFAKIGRRCFVIASQPQAARQSQAKKSQYLQEIASEEEKILAKTFQIGGQGDFWCAASAAR